MQMLKAKLYLLKQQEAEEKLSGIRGEVTDIGWGNQIRSYVMQPYTMVKDHRTNEETGNVDAVLDGDIDLFINAYLKWIALSKKQGLTKKDLKHLCRYGNISLVGKHVSLLNGHLLRGIFPLKRIRPLCSEDV